MAEIFQVRGSDAVISINHFDALNALTNFNWDGRFNEEQVQEIGTDAYAATTITPEVAGSFEATAVGNTVGILKRMIQKFNASTGAFEGYLAGYDPDEAGFGNEVGTVRSKDLEKAVFDLIEKKKPNETFSRATVLPRAHLSSLAIRADANGMGMETYNFEGDLVRAYESPYQDVIAIPGQRSSSTLVTFPGNYELSVTPGTAANTEYVVIALMVDDIIVPRASLTVGTVGGAVEPADDTLTLASPYTVPEGARISLLAYRKLAGSFPTLTKPTAARFFKANQIDIFLVENTGSNSYYDLADAALVNHADFVNSNRLLRAQSVDLNIDLRREALRQIAKTDTGNAVFYRGATYPLNVTANLSLLETSLAEWAKLQGKDLSVEGNYVDLAQFEGKTWQIVVRYYYNGTAVAATAMCDARVTAQGRRIAAGGRAEVTYGFTGSQLVFEGTAF